MADVVEITAAEARRIALAAQGLANGSPVGSAGVAEVRQVIAELQVLQLDPINVLVRSQYLPLFSRLGRYPLKALDELAYDRHELFEYVAHQASLIPVGLHPLMRWRMAAFAADTRWVRKVPPEYIDAVLAEVAERGPLAATDLSAPGQRTSPWRAMPGKQVLTWLTQTGRLVVAGRKGLQQTYDVPERVLPPDVLAAPAPERDEARRELLLLAARALGVGTAKDFAEYFQIGLGLPGISERRVVPKFTPPARLVADLGKEGRLQPVRVEGWGAQPAYIYPGAVVPSKVTGSALLSPFDSLIWQRDRTERLFGFKYRLEVYVPAAKREYGYYVLPVLHDGALVGRVDLKAERKTDAMDVLGVFAEATADPGAVARVLAGQLPGMAAWLGLGRVTVSCAGELADGLRRELS